MSKVTEAIRNHHQGLSRRYIERVGNFIRSAAEENGDAFVTFLRRELLPHSFGEEQDLYPVIDSLVRDHERPTATMQIDHEFIQKYVHKIADALRAYHAASPADRYPLADQIRGLGLQLYAILELHQEKEERVYLPLIERYLSAPLQERLLNQMRGLGQCKDRSDGQPERPATARAAEPSR